MPLEHRLHDRCACGSSLSSAHAQGAPRPFTLSGTTRVYERPRPFTVRHIALDLALDVKKKAFNASARLDIARVDPTAKEIVLDAVGFEISEVAIRPDPGETSATEGKGKNGRKGGKHADGGFEPAEYAYDGEKLSVRVAQGVNAASIRVVYRAAPRRGLYFLEPDEHVRDRPQQVWSQCQDEDARHIFPCHDKPHIKQTTELRVEVPEGWFALSNGELVNGKDEHGKGVFHWKMSEPHPSYLFTLAAGDFALIEERAGDVPITYYVPKGREEDGRRTFARTPDMVQHFGELLGVPYPWNKYAQVVVWDFIFGGMENTTATTMYEHILLDERAAIDISSDDLIAHELAHQWFGDLVTCRDWSHGWLNEGFATFMEHVDREHHKGRDEYDYGIRGDMEMYLIEARARYRRPIVCQDYDAPIDLFDRHLYEKGACVLHLLRRELGDELFWRGVRTYLTRHAKGVVETRDLMRALEEVSGKGLERFFEQWVYRAGHADLEVKVEYEDGVCTVSVKQLQAQGASHGHAHGHGGPGATGDAAAPVFALDLALDFMIDGEARREVRRVDQASHTFAFHLPKRPKFVVIDPELTVLGEVRVTAPGDMLRAQLAKAPTARGRMLAAEPLGKLDDPPTTKALAASLANEGEFWGVRAEAAEALGKLRSDEAFEALTASVGVKHPKVRRAIARALGRWKTSQAADVLKKMALRDESYLVEADAARSLGSTRHASALDTLVEILDRPSWADVIRIGAIDGLANLRDDRAMPHILARTRYGVNTRGRRAAIMALPKLSSDRRTRETLEDMLDAADPYLRVDIVRALGDLGDTKSRGALQRQLDRDLDGRVRRRIREVLRDLGGAGKRETDRLRDELEELRREHTELKSRIGKLEALGAKAAKPDEKAEARAVGARKGKKR